MGLPKPGPCLQGEGADALHAGPWEMGDAREKLAGPGWEDQGTATGPLGAMLTAQNLTQTLKDSERLRLHCAERPFPSASPRPVSRQVSPTVPRMHRPAVLTSVCVGGYL